MLQYAFDVLIVSDVIVRGGAKTALENFRHGMIDNRLATIRALSRTHREELVPLENRVKLDRLCELNVLSQARHVARTTIIEDAWERSQNISIHS